MAMMRPMLGVIDPLHMGACARRRVARAACLNGVRAVRFQSEGTHCFKTT